MAGRRHGGNWRTDLSADRFTPEELLTKDLQQQRLQQQIARSPVQDQLDQAHLAEANLTQARNSFLLRQQTNADRQRTIFYNTFDQFKNYLNNKGLHTGDPEYAAAMIDYARQIPDAKRFKDVADVLKTEGLSHDDQARMAQAKINLVPGLIPSSVDVTSTGGVNVRGRVETPESNLAKIGYTKEDFLNPYSVKRGTLNADTNAFETSDKGQGNVVQVTAGTDTKGQPIIRLMPIQRYNALQASIGNQAGVLSEQPTAPATPATGGGVKGIIRNVLGAIGAPSPFDEDGKTTALAAVGGQAVIQPEQEQPVIQGQPEMPQMATVASKEDYDALEPGTQFTSGGKLFTKPAPQPQQTEEE